jgi:hypothetical protein
MPEVALILGNREKERFVELALGTGDGGACTSRRSTWPAACA